MKKDTIWIIFGLALITIGSITLGVCMLKYPDTAVSQTAPSRKIVQLTGKIVDSKTKRPIKDAQVVLSISNYTTYFSDSNGIFVVSEDETALSTEFTVIVHKTGYKLHQFTVRSGTDGSKFGTIALKPE